MVRNSSFILTHTHTHTHSLYLSLSLLVMDRTLLADLSLPQFAPSVYPASTHPRPHARYP